MTKSETEIAVGRQEDAEMIEKRSDDPSIANVEQPTDQPMTNPARKSRSTSEKSRNKRMFNNLLSTLNNPGRKRFQNTRKMDVDETKQSDIPKPDDKMAIDAEQSDVWADSRESNRRKKQDFINNMVLYTDISPCVAYRPKILTEDQEKRLEPS